MKVWNGLDDLAEGKTPVVESIGNYDGVHRGHQAILESVVANAQQRGLSAALITFDPHPLTVVAPDRRPDLVQTRRQKLRSLERTGIDEVLIVPFDAALAQLEGQAFFDDYLLPRYPLAAVHVGQNFRFGKARRGDVDLLATIGRGAGFDVECVQSVEVDGRTISSSAVREAHCRGCTLHQQAAWLSDAMSAPVPTWGFYGQGASFRAPLPGWFPCSPYGLRRDGPAPPSDARALGR